MVRPLPDDVHDRIVDLYQQGLGAVEVARATGAGETTVYRILDKRGIARRADPHRRLRKLSDDQERDLVARYVAGGSSSALAEEFGVSVATVRLIVHRHGAASQRPGGRTRTFTPEEEAEIVRLYTEGMSQANIADRLHTSQIRISRLLATLRVPTRGGKNVTGSRHGAWRGGRVKWAGGYVGVYVERDDPFASMRGTTGYVLEHRLVMARALGRPLTRRETVHHVNGDRTDNRLENLQLRQGNHGKGVVLACADCGSHNVRATPL